MLLPMLGKHCKTINEGKNITKYITKNHPEIGDRAFLTAHGPANAPDPAKASSAWQNPLSCHLFAFLSRHHSDQMYEGSQVSKVTLNITWPCQCWESMAKHAMKADKKRQHTTQIAEFAELFNVKGCF